MNDREKLRHMLEHWLEHNREHAQVYKEWEKKARESGNEGVAKILDRLSEETKKLEELFEEALRRSEK